MKWTITRSTIPTAIGAGPNQHGSEPMTQSFTLTGPDGMEAYAVASADVTAKDVIDWARNMHGFESIKFGKLEKEPAEKA